VIEAFSAPIVDIGRFPRRDIACVTSELCTVLIAPSSIMPVNQFSTLRPFVVVVAILSMVVGRSQSDFRSDIDDLVSPMLLGSVPPNGACSGATVTPVPMNTPVSVSGNNQNAPTDPVFVANLVWEGFSISSCADVTVSYCGTSPVFFGGLVYLVTGCPITNLVFNSASNIVPNICGDGNFGIRFYGLPAGTYYYPVLEAPGSSGAYSLVFNATPCATTPPENALCAGAQSLDTNEECAFVSGTVQHATAAGVTGTACGNGDVSDGVWYSFQAVSSSYEITVQPSAEFNVHLSLFRGECESQLLLACAIGQNFGTSTTLSATGLVVGNTYYLRVADWYAGVPRTSTFDICVVAVANTDCEAAAGNVIPDVANVCYTGPSTIIMATPSGTSIVPEGFETTFLLVNSSEVVLAINDQPTFNAPFVGSFSIRTLVFDPATFDLDDITIGGSTIGSLNELFVQGGGEICASLDITGAGFTVENCCLANAASGTPVMAEVCWEEPEVSIAMVPGNSTVPAGYTVRYLLASMPNGAILDTSATPEFAVDTLGYYTIHTIVYDTLTFSLSAINLDTTTVDEVTGAFISGSGALCGDVDFVGVAVQVVRCCPGAFGTVEFANDTLCHVPAGAAFSWTLNDVDVPEGSTVLYLITAGDGVIIDTTSANAAVFTSLGAHFVHQLIYDSLLDLSSALVEGATLSSLEALLAQGGGDVCGLLDMAGAAVFVRDCRPANDDCSSPRSAQVVLVENCGVNQISGDNTYATQGTALAPSCGDPDATYADVWYMFNTGQNTGITFILDPGTMTSWGLSVQNACDGTELLCELQPAVPVDLDVPMNTALLVRVFSNVDVGLPGQFNMCIAGAVESTICNGGSVATQQGETFLSICQNIEPDVVTFTTDSSAPVNYTYVVTDTDSVIVAVIAGSALDLNALPLGSYLVHGISHDGDLIGASFGEALMDISGTGQCISFASNAVDVRVEICSVLEERAMNSWTIFPSPNEGLFSIVGPVLSGSMTIEVLGLDGRLVHAQNVLGHAGAPIHVDLSTKAAPGLYVVRVSSGSNVLSTQRMVVR